MRALWNEHGADFLGLCLQVLFTAVAGVSLGRVVLVDAPDAEVGFLVVALGCLVVALVRPWESR